MGHIFRSRIKYLILLFIIIISTVLALNMASCDSREKIIKIGSQAVLTGDYKAFGEDQLVSLVI